MIIYSARILEYFVYSVELFFPSWRKNVLSSLNFAWAKISVEGLFPFRGGGGVTWLLRGWSIVRISKLLCFFFPFFLFFSFHFCTTSFLLREKRFSFWILWSRFVSNNFDYSCRSNSLVMRINLHRWYSFHSG